MKRCDSVVEVKGLFPVVTLKAKSGSEGSHGEREASSFAEAKKSVSVTASLLLTQKIGVHLGKTINKMCLYVNDQETSEGCSSADGDLSYTELLLQVSAFANTSSVFSWLFCR